MLFGQGLVLLTEVLNHLSQIQRLVCSRCSCRYHNRSWSKVRSLEDLAAPLLLPDRCRLTSSVVLLLLIALIIGDNCIYRYFEDLPDANHLLATALHVSCSHFSCYTHALLLGDWGQSLGLEQVDAGSFVSKI
jgi:hypothetical protein